MFLGKMRSPRFYTELFMTAASAPPPPPPDDNPPPSGGGGGGSISPSPASPAAAKPDRSAKPLRVDAPEAPRASDPMDGPTLVAGAPSAPDAALVRKVAFTLHDGPVAAAPVTTQFRVEAASAPERGLFETVMGSLLGFVL
jgi:hypothetical protein